MKRITKDRSINTKVNSEKLDTQSTNLSKFKAESRPKLTRNKRAHITPEVEENSEKTLPSKPQESNDINRDTTQIIIKPEFKKEDVGDVQHAINEIKQEPEELTESTLPDKKPRLAGNTKLHKPPTHWEEMLNNLREMRKDFSAPVDSQGCDMCMDQTANPKDKRYQALLSLMLSSQTKDQVTFAAMQRLIEHGCTMDKILEMSEQKLGELIYPVSFWKSKVKYIKESTKMIKEQYVGDIPTTVVDLCKLKGVGPKMAHLCMKTAWQEVTGIGVDTHVHRISNRMGWVNSKSPEATRRQLEDWLPQHLWQEINHLLVGFGQQICQSAKPQCDTCLNKQLCPFGIKATKQNKE